MVTNHTRRDVWYGLVDVNVNKQYYYRVSRCYKMVDYITKIILGGSVLGVVTDVVAKLSVEWQFGLGAIVAVTLVFNLVSNLLRKSVAASDIADECEKLEIQWRELWAGVETYRVDETETRDEIQRLARSLIEITRRDDEAVLWYHRLLNRRCERLTSKIMESEYA